MTEPTPQELANWVLEVNNAGVPNLGSEVVTFAEGRVIIQGAVEAFRQCVFELFIIFDMDAETWFSDDYRRKWSDQIRMAYAQWVKDKT